MGQQAVSRLEPVTQAAGALAECVMSLYGLSRILGARDVGPAQLRPALDAFRRGHLGHCERVAYGVAALAARAEPHPRLALAVAALGDAFVQLAWDISNSLPEGPRIGAARRLEFDRRVIQLGARTEGLRAHLALVAAALSPRPIALSAFDLVEGRWTAPPTFVSQRVPITLTGGADRMLWTDPVVLWRLLGEAVRAQAAGDRLLTCRVDGDDGRITLRISGANGANGDGTKSFLVALAEPADVGEPIAELVAQHLGIDMQPGLGAISVATAPS